MSQFLTADDAVHAYLVLREETLAFVPAIFPGERMERPKQIPCPACGGRVPKWTTSKSKQKGNRWLCAAPQCGKPWPMHWVVDAAISSGRYGSPPMEYSRDLCADLGRIIGSLYQWEREVLLRFVQLGRQGGPKGVRRDQAVCEALRKDEPRVVGGWSRYRVRRLLGSARRKVEKRLDQAGLLK